MTFLEYTGHRFTEFAIVLALGVAMLGIALARRAYLAVKAKKQPRQLRSEKRSSRHPAKYAAPFDGSIRLPDPVFGLGEDSPTSSESEDA